MSSLWKGQLAKLALLLIFALIGAALFGAVAALTAVAIILLATVAVHVKNLAGLVAWLKRSGATRLPHGNGAWDEAFSLLSRMERGSRQSRNLLGEALQRFQLAGAALPDGLVIMDATDRIEWCNPAAEKHFGVELARDSGQQITYLMRQPEFIAYINSQKYDEPVVLRGVRNTDLTLSVRILRYGEKEKLILSRDITHLEKIERMRRDFVANVSHELRTPITVVSGFLETLEDMEKADSKMLSRSIHLMRDQTQRMQRLVEELLMLSRLESGQTPLREERVNLDDMIRRLVREAESLSRGKHRFKTEVLCNDDLLGAESELQSAFSNLVSNAVRYTPAQGEIILTWRRERDQGIFSVEDTGIGIASEHIPRLTERFYRVDRSRSRETGGTGLGLAIVKHVLQRHQASLEIESELGKGSRFASVFPAQRLMEPGNLPAVKLK